MKIKQGFDIRHMCGEHIVVSKGIKNIDFNKVISLNESAAYLFERAKGTDFTADMLAEWLTQEYAVDLPTATNDAKDLLAQWCDAGIVEEA